MGKSEIDGLNREYLRNATISLVLAKKSMGLSTSTAVSEAIDIMRCQDGNKLSTASVYRWLASYKADGWTGLQNSRIIRSHHALNDEFLCFLSEEKQKDIYASIPEVIRRARADGIIGRDQKIDRSTVYRHALRMNLPLLRQRREENNKRPYAYPHRMQMVLCDGKHFRAGPKRLKRMAYFFLDDATRYILAVVVGTSENSQLFLQGLFQVIATHGFMDYIYLDKGPGFIAKNAEKVAQKLDIPFIFGATRYPQGHGKIERFNRTCKADCLRGLDKPGIDPNLSALQLRLRHFTLNEYGERDHESLGMSPNERFQSDSRLLKFPESMEAIRNIFTLEETRKVREDNVIPFNGSNYEVPLGYAGTQVTVYFNTITGIISMQHHGRQTKLEMPDMAFNARERRVKTKKNNGIQQLDITTAAERNFNRDIYPIVDNDGGFTILNEEEE